MTQVNLYVMEWEARKQLKALMGIQGLMFQNVDAWTLLVTHSDESAQNWT